MSTRLFKPLVATLLMVAFVVPGVFFVAPPKVQAGIAATLVGDATWQSFTSATKNTITAIETTLTEINTALIEYATFAQYINTYILEPLAFVMSGKLMKALTAATIAFVIGRANGTGIPQFAVDVQKSIQTIQDSKELNILKQMQDPNSPWSTSMRKSLSKDYLKKSSLKGFWASNMCTLAQSSPTYTPRYLDGDWQAGGIAAWISLTTQVQNNPYLTYRSIKEQSNSVLGPGVGGASGERLAALGWGSGYMSWCGKVDTSADNVSNDTAHACLTDSGGDGYLVGTDCIAFNTSCSDSNGNLGRMTANGCKANVEATNFVNTKGVNPGDPCINEDGTSGVTKTPGSTIKATLDKVLGGQQDQVVRMGNIGPQINGILGSIATIMKTVLFAQQILGGNDADSSGGLLGAGSTAPGRSTSLLDAYANSSTLGVTGAGVMKSAATAPISGDEMTKRITNYLASWNTIKINANIAASSTVALSQFCVAAANTSALSIWNAQHAETTFGQIPVATPADLAAIHSPFIDGARDQAQVAQDTYLNQIYPILNQVKVASSTAATATAMVKKVQSELATTGSTDQSVAATNTAYLADVQTLSTMSPTDRDVVTVQFDAQSTGAAQASPAESLTVSGGTTIDRMNLITANAAALKTSVCTEKPVLNFGG